MKTIEGGIKIEFMRTDDTHLWYWRILVQDGHPYAESKPSFRDFVDCMEDFKKAGTEKRIIALLLMDDISEILY